MSSPGNVPHPSAQASPRHVERLWPGVLGWTGTVAFGVVTGVALLPVNAGLALTVGLVVAAAGLAVGAVTAPRVAVVDGRLHAGPARIPVALLADPRTLAGAELRAALGPGLDARAYLCLRGWIRTAVRVDVADPADPTPYWIVSTRRPDDLVAALTS